MTIGPLNFAVSCVKTLTAVEANLTRSNQHEFNGVTQLRNLMGVTDQRLNATFSVRGEDEIHYAIMTWYDARAANPIRTEYRFYFQPNPVMARATEGDNIIIGRLLNGSTHCELIPQIPQESSESFPEWTIVN
jgi:hypothetical protein